MSAISLTQLTWACCHVARADLTTTILPSHVEVALRCLHPRAADHLIASGAMFSAQMNSGAEQGNIRKHFNDIHAIMREECARLSKANGDARTMRVSVSHTIPFVYGALSRSHGVDLGPMVWAPEVMRAHIIIMARFIANMFHRVTIRTIEIALAARLILHNIDLTGINTDLPCDNPELSRKIAMRIARPTDQSRVCSTRLCEDAWRYWQQVSLIIEQRGPVARIPSGVHVP